MFLQYSVLGVELFLVNIGIVCLFRYYTKQRRVGWVEYVVVLSTYSLCLSAIVLLPTDFAKCIQEPDSCPLVESSGHHVQTKTGWTYFWTCYLWTILVLAWIVVPIFRAYVAQGGFTIWKRIWAAVKTNLIVYGCVSLACGGYILWALVDDRLQLQNVYAVAIAMSNAFGLLVVMLLLGYGLVELPRWLWRSGSRVNKTRSVAFRAVYVYEQFEEAKNKLRNTLGCIQILHRHIHETNAAHVNTLISAVAFFVLFSCLLCF